MLVASPWMPFSPRWLVSVGRHEEALDVLRRIHKGIDEDDSFYLKEFHQIKAQIELDREERVGFGAILRKKSYRHRLALILTFSFFCQMTGVIPIQNYQVVIYQKLGFSQVFSLVLTGIWGTNGTFSSVVAGWFVVDRLGRRPLLFVAYTFMISGGIMAVTLWGVYERGGSQNTAIGKAVIFGFFWFSFGYAGFMNTFGSTVRFSTSSQQAALIVTVSFGDPSHARPCGWCCQLLRHLQRYRHNAGASHANCH
jgi:ABC-type glycerol-3-phosphate transport system permease component